MAIFTHMLGLNKAQRAMPGLLTSMYISLYSDY